MADVSLNATVHERRVIAPGLFSLFVAPDGGVPDFVPGQYVALGLPDQDGKKIIKRAYSIASAPHVKQALEFYIAEVPGGDISSRLAVLSPGDRIFCQTKVVGTFTLKEVPHGKNLFLVATGTGIAPYVSMARSPGLLEQYSRVDLLHGVRFESDLAYRSELELLMNQSAGKFFYHPVLSRANSSRANSSAWAGQTGYVQGLFREGLLVTNPITDHIFLCGNPSMVGELTTFFLERGFQEHSRKSPGNVHLENYW